MAPIGLQDVSYVVSDRIEPNSSRNCAIRLDYCAKDAIGYTHLREYIARIMEPNCTFGDLFALNVNENERELTDCLESD